MNVTEIFNAFIALVCTIMMSVVVPYIKKRYNNAELDNFLAWVKIAVRAAEQLYAQTDGEAKKQYVFDFLNEKGVYFDELEVDNAIEAAVIELHHELYGNR